MWVTVDPLCICLDLIKINNSPSKSCLEKWTKGKIKGGFHPCVVLSSVEESLIVAINRLSRRGQQHVSLLFMIMPQYSIGHEKANSFILGEAFNLES